jgi:amino acid transporter
LYGGLERVACVLRLSLPRGYKEMSPLEAAMPEEPPTTERHDRNRAAPAPDAARFRLAWWRSAPERIPWPSGGAVRRLKRQLLGEPLPSREVSHERLPKLKALGLFAADALSSTAYATEEILVVLVAGGAAALRFDLPVAAAIVTLLMMVAISYRQAILKYPVSGGTYTVTKDNLGTFPALVAGAALLVDYTLTVAVSISAGVAAVTSAVPPLHGDRVACALLAVAFLTVMNLRGVRESGRVFQAPNLFFLGSMALLVGTGAWQAWTGAPAREPVAAPLAQPLEPLGLFLIARAFAAGCTAMTGTEAIANNVEAFRAPQARNAAATLSWMAAILAAMFLGITALAHHFQVGPRPQETVVSQVARAVFGHGLAYFAVQTATALVLFLAANTSFSGFPRLASFMAADEFLPRQFAFRGDRLVYSAGIIVLGMVSAALLVVFRADTHHLIPLYAVGVFVAFTLTQASLVKRWWTRREPRWRRGLLVNGAGAIATGCVTLIVLVTKFVHGAWLVGLIVPLMVVAFRRVHRYYAFEHKRLALSIAQVDHRPLRPLRALVPVSQFNSASVSAIRFAMAFSKDVTALHVTDDPVEGERQARAWHEAFPDVTFEVVASPYRALVAPVISYIAAIESDEPERPIVVVLSDHVPERWWQYPLYHLDTLKFKAALLLEPRVIVVDIPFHLIQQKQ